MHIHRGHLLSSAAMALAVFAANPAFAQTEPAAPAPAAPTATTTGEIVVTAQFRSQKLQDTPLAITAMNGASLSARGQTNIAEVAAQTPNVTLTPQNQYLGPGIIAFIRGVGQTDPNFALEPGVGMYVDDVYLPTLTGSLLDLMDLDRVEVLRGPQGTLSGRNSLGGSIKLFSVKPQGNNKGMLEVTYGSFHRVDMRGYVDTKITDNLFVRISGATKNRDGYVKRLDYALTHPGSNVPTLASGGNPVLGTLGGTSFTAAKVALRWLPTSNVEVNVSGDYTRQRDEPGASVLIFGNAIGQFAGSTGAKSASRPWLVGTNGASVPLNCAFVTTGGNSCDTLSGYDGRYVSYATYLDNANRDGQMPYKPYSLNPHSNLDNYGFAGTIDWTISDGLALKSITAYRHYDADWAFTEGSPVVPALMDQGQSNTQWSQEIRLSGKALDRRLDYTVGGFYFKADGTYTGRIDLNYAGVDFLHGPDTTPAQNKALFANGSFKPVDALTITAGVRSSWDSKDYHYVRRNPDGTAILPCNPGYPFGPTQPANCAIAGVNGLSSHFEKQRTDWRVAVDYRFSPQLMVYAQVATGYRSGGVNPRPYYLSQAKPFNPETLTAYEVGFKSDLFDRKLRFNVSAFYNDYKDIILTVRNCPNTAGDPATPCLQPKNVGSAHVKGFEIETTIKPVAGLTFDGSLSYLDFKYTSVDTATTGVTLAMKPPYTPKWKWNVGAQYDMADVLNGTLTFRVDGAYQSHIYTDPTNVDALSIATATATGGGGSLATVVATNKIDGYFLANGRITWKSQQGGWTGTFEVRNLTNKYYFTSLNYNGTTYGTVSGAPGLPRTWAVTVKKEF
ncbi:TonB-dependent receptor [Novosphingobium sp. FSY-8]|uniref:TonB-dependent receptor n=1 Tax=Novosphingobium ovatum TaxID=1908523 RepID=A0ABW9XDK5_9SPHN|nr:TonB-dependent receptor [Novosphingobium ovatum]NBC36585.1 TonB-dependent receptor [Novosphingobium ovatum]